LAKLGWLLKIDLLPAGGDDAVKECGIFRPGVAVRDASRDQAIAFAQRQSMPRSMASTLSFRANASVIGIKRRTTQTCSISIESTATF